MINWKHWPEIKWTARDNPRKVSGETPVLWKREKSPTRAKFAKTVQLYDTCGNGDIDLESPCGIGLSDGYSNAIEHRVGPQFEQWAALSKFSTEAFSGT